MEYKRIVKKLDKLSLYEEAEINFDDIKQGDIFRLYEDDNTAVKDENGYTIFIALEDAHEGKVNCVSYQELLEKELEK
jgi:succinylglutamate desuccinylase